MTLVDELLPLLDETRAIAADLGLRPYRVWICRQASAGYGKDGYISRQELLCGQRPPPVEGISSSDVFRGWAPNAEIKVTLTPAFDGGGYSVSDLEPSNPSEKVWFEVDGNGFAKQPFVKVAHELKGSFALIIALRTE